MTPLLTLALMIVLLVLVLWWLLVRTEGVYLGKRVVIWLYDVYAKRYDDIVQNDTVEEHLHLASPLMERIAPHTHPLVLDVATGTGRIPLALCHHARFEGHIIGLDLSAGMLREALRKISEEHFEDFVTFLQADGSHQLPFEGNAFDVVTCMEALEFMPQPENVLCELVRVLRPGGLLLTTRRINEALMPGKLWSEEQMWELLEQSGVSQIEFEGWQFDYAKVWAVKNGVSDFIGAMPLERLLRCPCCQHPMVETAGAWVCQGCQAAAPIHDTIIELQAIRC